MSYTLTPFPEWNLEDGRRLMADVIKRILFLERDRLKSFDIVDYQPKNVMDAMNLERMGFTEGMAVCQMVGHLQYAGDAGHTKVFRTHFPRCVALHDIERLATGVGESMLKQCRIMAIEEKRRKAPAVASNDDVLATAIQAELQSPAEVMHDLVIDHKELPASANQVRACSLV